MRESWTDKRLDEFRSDVNERFGRVENQIQGLRGEMKEGFEAQHLEMKRGFEAMHRLLVQSAIGLVAAFATIVAGLLGFIATQV